MTVVDPYAPQELKFRRTFMIATVGLMIPLAALLVAVPEIDLTVSGFAKELCPASARSLTGAWCPASALNAVRSAFIALFMLVVGATLAVSVGVLIAKRKLFGTAQARCWFMIAVLVVGPGVVTNLIFKDNFGRARPRDVIELGGTKVFSPPLLPAQECQRNCSFVCGEAASMFAPLFALVFLFPRYRRSLLLAALTTGLVAGAVRMMQGAHFLSDVLFAGIFMALTVSLLHVVFIDSGATRSAHGARSRPRSRP
ncbi:MAG: phosphatase PAP2 family protein [Hyphomicrobiaceae bacterium]